MNKKNIINQSMVCSIIVSFETNKSFFEVVKRQLKNFNKIIIVNNSPGQTQKNFKSNKRIHVIDNQINLGLAIALNIGIQEAKKQGFSMVALFDQDTILPANFSKKMLGHINSFQYEYKNKISVFAPIYFNEVTKTIGLMINFKILRLVRSVPKKITKIHFPQYVITSGSFIPISVLDDVGLMRGELFIDFIDIEWCLRASSKGYSAVSFTGVKVSHRLGDSSFKLFSTSYPIHSPLRMYYYFRNSIYVYGLPRINLNWKIIDAFRNLARFIFYVSFIPDRKIYFKYITKGYYHGLIKKMGKLNE